MHGVNVKKTYQEVNLGRCIYFMFSKLRLVWLPRWMSDMNRQDFLKHKRLISNSSKHCERLFRCKHQETFGTDSYICRRRSQPFPLFSTSWSLSRGNTKENLQGLEWSPLSTPGFKTTPEASCIVTHFQKQAQEISLQQWVWLGRCGCGLADSFA